MLHILTQIIKAGAPLLYLPSNHRLSVHGIQGVLFLVGRSMLLNGVQQIPQKLLCLCDLFLKGESLAKTHGFELIVQRNPYPIQKTSATDSFPCFY